MKDEPSNHMNENDMQALRQEFIAAVRNTMDRLMHEGGLGRATAAAAIVAHLHPPPADKDVWNFMQTHGLGQEQAMLALTVAAALKQRQAQHGTLRQALQALTRAVQQVTGHPPQSAPIQPPSTTSTTLEPNPISLPPLKLEKVVTTLKPKHRKRADSCTAETTNKRLRADSVAEEVKSKVVEISVENNQAKLRSKRARDDAETATPAKRRKNTV